MTVFGRRSAVRSDTAIVLLFPFLRVRLRPRLHQFLVEMLSGGRPGFVLPGKVGIFRKRANFRLNRLDVLA